MRSRLYVGATPQAAMAKVRRELGKDALIISCIEREEDGMFEVRASPPLEGSSNRTTGRQANLYESRLLSELDSMVARFESALGKQDPEVLAWTRRGLPEEHALSLKAIAKEQGVNGLEDLLATLPEPSLGSKFQVFLGPQAVGKSTIVAKLAIQAAAGKDKGSWALLGAGLRRATDVDRITSIAGITGVPYYIAVNAAEVKRILPELAEHSKVLVDTPGIAPWDREELLDLHSLLELLPGARHLVISAQSRPVDMLSILEAFKTVGYDHLAFSKFDVAVKPASVLSCIAWEPLPISYISKGSDCSEGIFTGISGPGIKAVKGWGRSGTGFESSLHQES